MERMALSASVFARLFAVLTEHMVPSLRACDVMSGTAEA